MSQVETKYARPQCSLSMNTWGKRISGNPDLNFWVPSKNEFHLGAWPESGKPDGLVRFQDRTGKLIFAAGIEVKGFDEGQLPFGIVRENQVAWSKNMGWPVYIFLMGFPNLKITKYTDLRQHAEEWRNAKAWLLPIDVYEKFHKKHKELLGTNTIHWDMKRATRNKEIALANQIGIVECFRTWELLYVNRVWVPNLSHPILEILGEF